MTRYNPYLKMKYNPKTDEITITSHSFKMWAETFRQISPEQFSQFMETLNYFTDTERRKENE